ncbi:MAG TPA: GNAT family protein [Anaerolineae bacterium]|nr:GNAT family protein [Anaerolineae bacterium]
MRVRARHNVITLMSPPRLEGRRVIVRVMRHRDLAQIRAWRPFHDPLSPLWNIAPSRRLDPLRLLAGPRHDRDPRYTIERRGDGQIVGRMSLRDIDDRISARLGVRLGADFVDQGYGTEAIVLLLEYCFRTLGFERLYLDVAAVNVRAMRVYERMGFRHTGRHYRNVPAGVDLSFLELEPYHGLLGHFRRRFGRKQLLFYDMMLEHSEWEKQSARAHSP